MSKLNVLVSGVAGDIGFGAGRILRDWGIFDQLHGIDISDDHPASMVFDAVDVAPRADDARYLEWLGAYIGSNRIDVFIPTSEAEILAVTRDPGALADRCTVLVNEPTLAIACLDKHSTLAFLSQNGIDVPEHGLIGHGTAPSRYPVIAKPRSGQGSKGFQTVDSLEMLQSSPAGHVWQECLLPDDQEYTCAVYVTKELATRLLVIKRVLVGGYTGKGEVVDVPVINDYLVISPQPSRPRVVSMFSCGSPTGGRRSLRSTRAFQAP